MHEEIDGLAKTIRNDLVRWHRILNAMPEMANREFQTADFLAEQLSGMGVDELRTGVAGTGLLALVRGGQAGDVVALRAEMDADVVAENDAGVDVPGISGVRVAHRLGHDVNMTLLLGVARVLVELQEQLVGAVKFVFQPAHATMVLPSGETGGAEIMVRQGALQDPEPSAMIAVQCDPEIASGAVEYGVGAICASAHRLHIVIKGRAAFGAFPWMGLDPLPVAAQVILALQTVMARQMDVTRAPALLSIGVIQGGRYCNRIPDHVEMEGTIRLLDAGMEEDLFARVKRTVMSIAEASGLSAKVSIESEVPLTENNPPLAEIMAKSFQRPGLVSQILSMRPTMGSENFAFFARELPAFYFSIGTKTAPDSLRNDATGAAIEPEILVRGVRILTSLALDYLHGGNRTFRESSAGKPIHYLQK